MSGRLGVPRTPAEVLVVLPTIADELAPNVKSALAVRNVCVTEGRCPSCGATGVIEVDGDYPGILHWKFSHEDGCTALTEEEL